MKKNNFTEMQMVIEFCKILKKDNINFSVEVPFFHRSIDLIFYNKKNEICAVEFKLRDWKKAIKQAEDYKLWADLSYICLPLKDYKNLEKVKEFTKKSNCWLILFDPITWNKEIYEPIREKDFINAKSLIEKWIEYANKSNTYDLLLQIS